MLRSEKHYRTRNPLHRWVVATIGEQGQRLLGIYKSCEEVLALCASLDFRQEVPTTPNGEPYDWPEALSQEHCPDLWILNPGHVVIQDPDGYWYLDHTNHQGTEELIRGSGICCMTEDEVCFADPFWLTPEHYQDRYLGVIEKEETPEPHLVSLTVDGETTGNFGPFPSEESALKWAEEYMEVGDRINKKTKVPSPAYATAHVANLDSPEESMEILKDLERETCS